MMPKIYGLDVAVQGLRKQGDRVTRDVDTMNKAFAAAQNAQAADSVSVSDKASIAPAVEDAMRGAVLAPEGDVTKALVDVLQAKAAYGANVQAAKVTGDIQSEIYKMFGNKA
ncbi:MAG: hypothetical protein GC129_00880 [Proteobacteria bacterium]|nr:hypothetical protein [Pseudomonadota bacterium]